MKSKNILIAVALAALCGGAIQSANALSFSIGTGDRAYYEGPTYWDNGFEYVWVPGHSGRDGRWEHGSYRKQGTFVKSHEGEHHVVRIVR